MPRSSERPGALLASAFLTRIMLICLFAVIAVRGMRYLRPDAFAPRTALSDFDVFWTVGHLLRDGRVLDAYDLSRLVSFQTELTGVESYMPWAYPPPFNLLVGLLSFLPVWAGYYIFVLSSLLLLLAALRRLSPQYWGGAVMIALPAFVVNVLSGQNGFLVAGLIGWMAVMLRDKRVAAGIPLGLMVLKPHLAVGSTVLLVARRNLGVLVVAATVTILLAITATVVSGTGVWESFLDGASRSSSHLKSGHFSTYRLVSVFASLYGFGFSLWWAMAIQIVASAAAVSLILFTRIRGWPPMRSLGLAILISPAFPPYIYDYDLALLTVAWAILLPEFIEKSRGWEISAIAIGSLVASSWGIVVWGVAPDGALSTVTPAGPLLAATAVIVAVVLERGGGQNQRS